MFDLAIHTWELDFLAAAEDDRYDIFRDHLQFLELPGEPISMIQATILVVVAIWSYYNIDGRPSDDFLEMQTYYPAKSTDAPYTMTFDLNWKREMGRRLDLDTPVSSNRSAEVLSFTFDSPS
jgi:hypothetical protein